MATWPHILAKDKTNILQEGLHTSSAGGAGFPARGSQSTGSRASHTALAKTPCVEGGTHPKFRDYYREAMRTPEGDEAEPEGPAPW
jgi:hypothetical protein